MNYSNTMRIALILIGFMLLFPVTIFAQNNPIYTYPAPDVWNNVSAYDQAQVISSIQAIVNKTNPTLYLLDNKGQQLYWFNQLKLPGQFLDGKPMQTISSFSQLVETFKNQIDGAVVWGNDCYACKNVAVTSAGADGRRLIIIRYDSDPNSTYSLLTKPVANGGFGIPILIDLTNKFTGSGKIFGTTMDSTGSIKNDAYKWAIVTYIQTGKTNPQLAAYRLDGYWIYKTQTRQSPDVGHLYDNDYLISQKAFVFDLDPWPDEIPLDDPNQTLGLDHTTLRVIYEQMLNKADPTKLIKTIGFPPFTAKYSTIAPNGPSGLTSTKVPWQTEWKFAQIASLYNSYMEADIEGTMNTSFTRFIPNISYVQNVSVSASKKELFDKGYLSKTSGLSDKKFILYVSSDFDAVSWLQSYLIGENKNMWLDPKRGSLPIAWAINPQMVDRVPNIFNYLFQSKSANDFFIGGDSGAGYINPTYLMQSQKIAGFSTIPDGVNAWVNHNKHYYQLLNYSITANLLNGYAGDLTQAEILNRIGEFSPNGATILKSSLTNGNIFNTTPIVAEARSNKTGTDTNMTASQLASMVTEELATKQFTQFRTILNTPSTLFDAHQIVKSTTPNAEAVDPYTFFELLKIKNGMDTIPPACNFCINNCSPTTTSTHVQLGTTINYIDGQPNASGVTKVRFSNDATSWTEFSVPLATPIAWDLPLGNGTKTVYMQALDAAGNWGNSDDSRNMSVSTIILAGPTNTPPMAPGDLNGDTKVDMQDILFFLAHPISSLYSYAAIIKNYGN